MVQRCCAGGAGAAGGASGAGGLVGGLGGPVGGLGGSGWEICSLLAGSSSSAESRYLVLGLVV